MSERCETIRPEPSVPLFGCRRRAAIVLSVLIAVQLALYALLYLLSQRFHFDAAGSSRPLLATLAVLAAAFAAYLVSLPAAIGLGNSRTWLALFIAVAVAIRLVVLFSEPIQEVDIYRYIWDGAVSGEGVSPYQFPPLQIGEAVAKNGTPDASHSSDLQKLVTLAEQERGLREVLRRVHFGHLRTVYPPVSQLVFWMSDKLTPSEASVTARVRVMKSIIVLFDLGVMLLLIRLLVMLRMRPGWCVAYGWSPLVVKEFANSGHLDSIAVFLCMSSVVCLVWASEATRGGKAGLMMVGGLLLGLGVGAKLYPIVLLPVVACFVGRLAGLRWSGAVALVVLLVATASLIPMWALPAPTAPTETSIAGISEPETIPMEGLRVFLRHWEINDLLFMIVQENVRPEQTIEGQQPLWFAVTPQNWRITVTTLASNLFRGDFERTPFLLARLITTLVFAAIVLLLCRRLMREPVEFFCEAVFLTLAWFWLLSPTQNPWYWCWALPFVPMARNRIWVLLSGLTLIYYFRFWFGYHAPITLNWSDRYHGVAFFDFIVVWIEFGPFLLMLLGYHLWWRDRLKSADA